MSRTRRRAWAWTGGVWLALVLAGGGATLALQPGEPSRGDDSRGGRPSGAPAGPSTEVPEGCEDEEAEARRRWAREGGKRKYGYVCITVGQGNP